MNSFVTYKNKIASRYIPVDATQIGIKIPESDYYMTSTKFDGHLTFLIVKDNTIQLLDRNGEELKIEKITKSASIIKDNCVLVGELCSFNQNKPTSHREVNQAIAQPEKFDLRFGAFDILELNGKEIDLELDERLKKLNEMLIKGKEIFPINQNYFESRKDVIEFFKSSTNEKSEGVIVKTPNGITYKIKQIHHLDLVVLGYAESTGEKEGQLRDLLLGFACGNNKYQLLGKCGGGFSDLERKEIPKQLEKLSVNSEYTEVSSVKTAFIFVKPEIVVEISCLDLINENSEGAIQKALLSFDKEKGYSFEGNENTLSIISPNYIQIRSDKKVNELETGSKQAYLLREPLISDKTSQPINKSEIVIREVFLKDGKSGPSVRKFVGLKTNKEGTKNYPSYLVIFTDYSSSRQKPLEQEVYLCANEQEVKSKIDLLKEENIKKGWEAYN